MDTGPFQLSQVGMGVGRGPVGATLGTQEVSGWTWQRLTQASCPGPREAFYCSMFYFKTGPAGPLTYLPAFLSCALQNLCLQLGLGCGLCGGGGGNWPAVERGRRSPVQWSEIA